jgi:hypothetical protein
MIREIVKPQGKTYTLQLPDDMVGKVVEVIAFAIEEPSNYFKKSTADLKNELKGLTIDMEGFKFDRTEANDYGD